MAKKNEIAKAEVTSIQSVEQIESLIITVRGKQVILDRDLARLYGVETKRLNEQVRRNIERFPEDFMFQVSKKSLKIGSRNLRHPVQKKICRRNLRPHMAKICRRKLRPHLHKDVLRQLCLMPSPKTELPC